MFVTKEEMNKTRLNLVHQMHEYIMNTRDEEIYEIWIRDCIPDDPCEEDFEYFTDPVEFEKICSIFGYLARRDGLENYSDQGLTK